ncbi:DUF1284 domain-containing protein [Methanobacterium oryzae]|uniref:DUF1284 domain-containing protein n=1 Tax=Methanobacterium oryzae TaxID=69540 RepID=UPI003D22D4BD
MKIRAHHLLCMQGFQGYGYSKEFSQNMAKIIDILNSDDKQEIEIIAECDIICSCCPHLLEGKCFKNPMADAEIIEMDLKVLEKLGLESGIIFEANEIFTLINETLNSDNIHSICRNCRWKDKCLWFLEKPQK